MPIRGRLVDGHCKMGDSYQSGLLKIIKILKKIKTNIKIAFTDMKNCAGVSNLLRTV